jgi:acetylornithine aminotransferase/acetylornithine/N-succinyldiaminopimelate aminotransferase
MLTTTHPAEVPVYGRLQLQLERGAGSTVVGADGRRFLDLYGGHAVAVSGHCHPLVVAAIREQAERLLFYSNAVPLESRDRLFAVLAEMAPAPLDQAFLVNSGAETNDVALQLARRVTGRRRVMTFEGGFHGRTLATLAVSGIPHYRDLAEASGGQSILDLTVVAPWGRPEVLPALVDETIAAVIVEPVQGLAGAREVGADVLRTLRRACDDTGAVLIFDEVQCGCGRTGAFTAAQSYGVTPDILTLAKGIAAGLPMGAVLLSPRIAKHVSQGDLGTTFGGGPIPCAAAAANLEVIRDESLAARALHLERRLRQALADLSAVTEITGRGLLLGLRLDRPARPVKLRLFERGILVGSANDPSIIRLLPPLVLAEDEVDTFVHTLHEVLS